MQSAQQPVTHNGEVSTNIPLAPEESEKKYPCMHVDIAPFVPELSTLTDMWLGELPFGIASPLCIPQLSNIKRYKIRSSTLRDIDGNLLPLIPALTLLLNRFDARSSAGNGTSRMTDFTLRKALMADERGYTDAESVRLREKSFIITTWTWDREAKTASFWLDSNVMEKMLVEQPYCVNIPWTDIWDSAVITDVLNLVLSVGESWIRVGKQR